MKELLRSLKRLGRSAVSLLAAGALIRATNDPKWIIVAPLVQALAKYLRDKFGVKYIPM